MKHIQTLRSHLPLNPKMSSAQKVDWQYYADFLAMLRSAAQGDKRASTSISFLNEWWNDSIRFLVSIHYWTASKRPGSTTSARSTTAFASAKKRAASPAPSEMSFSQVSAVSESQRPRPSTGSLSSETPIRQRLEMGGVSPSPAPSEQSILGKRKTAAPVDEETQEVDEEDIEEAEPLPKRIAPAPKPKPSKFQAVVEAETEPIEEVDDEVLAQQEMELLQSRRVKPTSSSRSLSSATTTSVPRHEFRYILASAFHFDSLFFFLFLLFFSSEPMDEEIEEAPAEPEPVKLIRRTRR